MFEKTITIVIVEDHQMIAEMFFHALEGKSIKTVGIAKNRTHAVSLIKKEMPRIVLMDIGLPDGDGIELTAELRRTYPSIDIIILTASTQPDDMLRSIRAG